MVLTREQVAAFHRRGIRPRAAFLDPCSTPKLGLVAAVTDHEGIPVSMLADPPCLPRAITSEVLAALPDGTRQTLAVSGARVAVNRFRVRTQNVIGRQQAG